MPPRRALVRETTFMPRAWGVSKRRALQVGRARSAGARASRPAVAGELKFHDVDLDDAVVAGAGGITETINIIAQGVTETTRVGRQAIIRSIAWRYNCLLPTTSTPGDTSDAIRVIMYLDKQANKLTAAVTDILESADWQSFNNLANRGRFRVLMDRTHQLVSKSGAWDGTNDQFGEDDLQGAFYKTCNIPIEYNAGTGAMTEITSNNLGVLLISRDGKVFFGSKIRLRFTDS